MTDRRRALTHLASALRGEGAAPSDWTPLLGLANELLLAPSLWSVLCASGQAGAVPAEVADYLKMLHGLNGERNAVIRRQAMELIGALNAAGIVPALLKGALTLFDGPYDDPAARMMRDIDLLVPTSSRNGAIAVLERLGYRLARGYGESHHAYGDFARDGDPAAVDLHTELVDPRHVLTAAEVRRRGSLLHPAGVSLIKPSATDRVLHNFLHAEIHHLGHYYRGEIQIAQMYELTALAKSFGPAVDWAFIEARMKTHRLEASLHSYLWGARQLFGLAWPLARGPKMASRFHYLRCQVQADSLAANWAGVTWGNLHGPLAWHRMRALYGKDGNALAWRLRHVSQFLRRKGARAGAARLRRTL